MNNNILDLLRKLKALAEQGVDGERENATDMLHRLMAKHGITMEDLGIHVLKEREFYIADKEMQLFVQVLGSVTGPSQKILSYKRDTKKLKSRFVELTDADYIEVEAKWEFYRRAWKEERERQLQLLMKAFVHKNRLYPKKIEGQEATESMPTLEDLQELEQIKALMAGMKHHHFAKQLSNG